MWSVNAPSLPPFTDLLVDGVAGTGVTMASPRADTGTIAYTFTGMADSIVITNSFSHPQNIDDGSLSLSVWVTLNSASNGMLFAKATSDASTIYYGLSVQADGDSYIIRLSYLPSNMDVSIIYHKIMIYVSCNVQNMAYTFAIAIIVEYTSLYSNG